MCRLDVMAFERERTIERARRKSALARFIGMPGMPIRCLDVLQNLQTLGFFPRITLYVYPQSRRHFC